MKMVNIYRLTDIDTNEVVIEGTADKFAEKGYTTASINGASRTGRLFMGKYRVSVVGEVAKIYKKNPNPNPKPKVKNDKKAKSNLKIIQEINKKAAEQDLSYGQYQAKERKIKTTFDANLGCWKQIEIG